MSTSVQRTAQLRKKIESLEALARETENMFQQIENDLAANIRQYESLSQGVDVSADIMMILLNLGKIVAGGMRASALHGKALEEANKELGKEAVKFGYEPARDVVAKQWASTIGANDGHLYAFGKIAMQSFFNLTTPSFWAGVYTNLHAGKTWQQAVTEDPKGALEDALAHVREQRQRALAQLKAKIAESKLELGQGSPTMGQFPALRQTIQRIP
jgi:glutamate-1-semialdehyde aminotransferase